MENNIGQWGNVNVAALDAIMNNSANMQSQNSEENTAKVNEITKLVTAKQYPWKDEVVSSSLCWATPKISHVIKEIAAQIFSDVESAFVDYDVNSNKVVGTIYFKFNAVKSNDDDLLAFGSYDNKTPANGLAQQIMMLSAKQHNGSYVITKEGQEILSDWIYTDSKINKNDKNWINHINWSNYVSLVQSASETGCSIKVTNLNVAKIISLIINHETIKETNDQGQAVETTRKLDVIINPGTTKRGTFERIFDIIIYDNDRAKAIASEISGTNMIFNNRNNYVSYI